MDYDKLKTLSELRRNGDITEEEFEREKSKLLNEDTNTHSNITQKPLLGLDENTYLMLMHLSQFAGWIIPFFGYVVTIVMWMLNKDSNENVNTHGKNILNFTISYCIYTTIAGILVILLIGIPILIVLGSLWLIFIIVATIKASNGEYWRYPFTIDLIK